SRSVPIASTSKPAAHPRGPFAQVGFQVSPEGKTWLAGTLHTRSHSSSVHNRYSRASHRRSASSRVTPTRGGALGSFGYGRRSTRNGPSSTSVLRCSTSGRRPGSPGRLPARNAPAGTSTRSPGSGSVGAADASALGADAPTASSVPDDFWRQPQVVASATAVATSVRAAFGDRRRALRDLLDSGEAIGAIDERS